MTDTVIESFAWPVNSAGEIIASAGAGDDTVVAYLPSNMVPIGATGGVALKLPTAVAGLTEGEWIPLTLETGWSAEGGFAAPAYRVIGTTVQVHFVVAAGITAGGAISVLPVGVRPEAVITATVFGEDGVGNDTTLILLNIAPTGQITVENIIITGDEYIYANFSFPLNLGETPVTP